MLQSFRFLYHELCALQGNAEGQQQCSASLNAENGEHEDDDKVDE